MDLEKSWAITRKHLEKARSLLPSPIVQGEQTESIGAYQEFIEHNELECALDQLEGLGEANACSQEFWQELRLATENMGLTDRLAYYDAKLKSA